MAKNEDIGKQIGVEVAAALKGQAKAIGFRMDVPGLIASLKNVAETFKGIQMMTLAAAAKSDKTLANVGRTFAQGNFSLKAVIASEKMLIKANMKRHAFDTRYLTFLQEAGVDSKAMLMQLQFMQQTLGTTAQVEVELAQTLHATAGSYGRHTDLLVRALKGVEEAAMKTQFLGGEGKGVDFTKGVAEMTAKYGDQHVKAIQDIANKFLVPSVEQLQRLTLLGLSTQDVAGGTGGAIQTVIDAMNNSHLGGMRGGGEMGGYQMAPLMNVLGISNEYLALMQAEHNEAYAEQNLELIKLNDSISKAREFAGTQWDKLLGTVQLALLPVAEQIAWGVRKLAGLAGYALPVIVMRLSYLTIRSAIEWAKAGIAGFQRYRQLITLTRSINKMRHSDKMERKIVAVQIKKQLFLMKKNNLISAEMLRSLRVLNFTNKMGFIKVALATAAPLIIGALMTAAMLAAAPKMESLEFGDADKFADQQEERDRIEKEIAERNLEQNKRVADHLSPQSNISALTERSNALATAMLQSLTNQAIIAEDTFDELQISNELLAERIKIMEANAQGNISIPLQQ